MDLTTLSYTEAAGWTRPLPNHDSPRTLVLAFGAAGFFDRPEAFRTLKEQYPTSHIVGCSTAGEIAGTRVSDGTIAVAVARFEHVELRSTITEIADGEDSFGAGRRIAQSLDAPSLRSIFLLSDGLAVNGSQLVRGANEGLASRGVVVTGGLAGDGDRFQRTWVLRDGLPSTRMVTAVGFYGDRLKIAHGSKGGWDKFGLERFVTRSKSNVLYELDGQPALALYKEYLGERASGLPATALLFPLALRVENSAVPLVRTVLAVNEADQSMTFAGDVPEGARVQLMRANFDRLVQGASDAASNSRLEGAGSNVLAIAISCVGRRLVLGERVEEEVDATLDVLPQQTRQVGFYSYGEISPHTTGTCDLHNQTMTLTTLSEL